MNLQIVERRGERFRQENAPRNGRIRFGVVILIAMLGLPRLPAAEPAPAKLEPFDLLCLSSSRPFVVRLHVSNDGKLIQEEWNRFADALFAKIDADKNGAIDEKELIRLRPILTMLAGSIVQMRGEPASTGQKINRAEFGEHLKRIGFGPVRIQSPVVNGTRVTTARIASARFAASSREELDKELLELLDTNKDGKLSVAEFTAGIAILSKLDVDENELLSVDEVLRRPMTPSVIMGFDGTRPQVSFGMELILLSRKGQDPNLARRMLIRYGPKPLRADRFNPAPNSAMRPKRKADVPVVPQTEPLVRRLTKKELKMSDELFAALDQDGNNELDMEELSRLGQHAQAEIEVAIRLGKLNNGEKPAEVIFEGKPPLNAFTGPRRTAATPSGSTTPQPLPMPQGLNVRRGAEITIDVPGTRLNLGSTSTSIDRDRTMFRSYYVNHFANLDQDSNGYLDMNEAALIPEFRELFTFLDKDGDGKIFEKELTAAIDELDEIASAAASGILSIDLTEASRGLFGLIDANGDERISVRELRAMPKLVEQFSSNKDGTLAMGDMPRRFAATLTPGTGVGRPLRFPPTSEARGARPPQMGPRWFQKMDRNRDGDVSRREFLGNEEDFRKLDLDGDGLISAQEAEAAEIKSK